MRIFVILINCNKKKKTKGRP